MASSVNGPTNGQHAMIAKELCGLRQTLMSTLHLMLSRTNATSSATNATKKKRRPTNMFTTYSLQINGSRDYLSFIDRQELNLYLASKGLRVYTVRLRTGAWSKARAWFISAR